MNSHSSSIQLTRGKILINTTAFAGGLYISEFGTPSMGIAAAGVHFGPATDWLLQLGFAYDTSPVNADDRTPDMPIDRQIRYATGVQCQWSERLNVGGSFVYADYGDAKIKNDLRTG